MHTIYHSSAPEPPILALSLLQSPIAYRQSTSQLWPVLSHTSLLQKSPMLRDSATFPTKHSRVFNGKCKTILSWFGRTHERTHKHKCTQFNISMQLISYISWPNYILNYWLICWRFGNRCCLRQNDSSVLDVAEMNTKLSICHRYEEVGRTPRQRLPKHQQIGQ